MRKLLLLALLYIPAALLAQNTITGIILEETSTEPAANATVIFTGADTVITSLTNNEGKFTQNLPAGAYKIELQVGSEKFLLNESVQADKWLTNTGVVFYKKMDLEDETNDD